NAAIIAMVAFSTVFSGQINIRTPKCIAEHALIKVLRVNMEGCKHGVTHTLYRCISIHNNQSDRAILKDRLEQMSGNIII
ncbi:MAG TPA: hypothetical protein DDZ65_12570, partial [Firmicutes bacterium]|nr:hypothetical protein [Bacillota bacterium]